MFSIHPEEWKTSFSSVESLSPQLRLRCCSSQGCACFPRRCPPLRSATRGNQGDSHPTTSGVKSTFVGQVRSALRTHPDAQTSPNKQAARKSLPWISPNSGRKLKTNSKNVKGKFLPAASALLFLLFCVVGRGGSPAASRRHVWRRRRMMKRRRRPETQRHQQREGRTGFKIKEQNCCKEEKTSSNLLNHLKGNKK